MKRSIFGDRPHEFVCGDMEELTYFASSLSGPFLYRNILDVGVFRIYIRKLPSFGGAGLSLQSHLARVCFESNPSYALEIVS